jgi:hypothetical protein
VTSTYWAVLGVRTDSGLSSASSTTLYIFACHNTGGHLDLIDDKTGKWYTMTRMLVDCETLVVD